VYQVGGLRGAQVCQSLGALRGEHRDKIQPELSGFADKFDLEGP